MININIIGPLGQSVVCHYHYHYDKYNWVELSYNRSTGTRPLYRPGPGETQAREN